MRKLLSIAVGLSVTALLAQTPAPKPIPAEKQEQLSRALLDAKDAQIELMQSPAWAKLQAANGRIEHMVTEIEKDYGAPGCKLTKDKTWQCAKEEKK
jgi:hypothetical protein